MPTLSDLRTVVRHQTLAETDDVSTALLNTYLNQGYYELSLAFDWPWVQETYAISVVDGTQGYAVPADYRVLLAIVDEDKRRTLTQLTPQEALGRFGGDMPEGSDATYYYIWEDTINLIPIPDTTAASRYTLYYQKAVTALSADADEPLFADEFHLILAYYAIARVWEHEEEFDKARQSDDTFNQKAGQMARYYNKRERRVPLVLGGGSAPLISTHGNMPWLDGA